MLDQHHTTRRAAVAFAGCALALAIAAPAATARSSASCNIQVQVAFDSKGALRQADNGSTACIGVLADKWLRPTGIGMRLRGDAVGGQRCAPRIRLASLALTPVGVLPLVPPLPVKLHLGFGGQTPLSDDLMLLAGKGLADKQNVSANGTLRFTAAQDGSCSSARRYAPGTVSIDIALR